VKVEYYEKVFLGLTVIVQAAFLGAILYGLTFQHIEVARPAGRVDPETLTQHPPFDNLGVHEISEGNYQINLVARFPWIFDAGQTDGQPTELRVPAGSRVKFAISSPDVVHGFRVIGTNINVMVIPGQISTQEHTFDEPGEYLIVCHEYCGVGHQGMFTKLIVTENGAATRTDTKAVAETGGNG
jgi:cytochrome c oxidase subunit 2